jgi:ribosome-binding protein aMBF1 (putative translation factor)
MPSGSAATVPADYAARIARARARHGPSVAGLADRIGVALEAVLGWGAGGAPPSPAAWQLIRALDGGAGAGKTTMRRSA